MSIPRPEHPRRQFQRANWINLSGQWTFRINQDDSSLEAGWVQDPTPLDRQAKFDAQRLRQALAATATIEPTYASWNRYLHRIPTARRPQVRLCTDL